MQKAVQTFYNVLSWIVWAFFICTIFFLLFLLLTGSVRKPVFTVAQAAVTAADPADPALAARGLGGEHWYRVDLDLTVRGSSWSPLSYSAEGFTVKGSDALKYACPGFVELDAETPLEFSAHKSARTVLRYYVQFPAGRDALLRELESAGVGTSHFRHQLGFFSGEAQINVPGFYLKDYALTFADAPIAPIEQTEETDEIAETDETGRAA